MALSFTNSGRLHNSVLAPHSYLDLPGTDQYTYWQFPLYLASLGLWFRLVPGTIQAMGMFSVVWSGVYLCSWFVFVRALSGSKTIALFLTSVVAFDYSCLAAASNGRMEMMCAALGQAALAVYVTGRDRNRIVALLIAGTLGSASFFCHPMGAVTSASLLALVICDWRRMSIGAIAVLGVPYLTGAGLCLLYYAGP